MEGVKTPDVTSQSWATRRRAEEQETETVTTVKTLGTEGLRRHLVYLRGLNYVNPGKWWKPVIKVMSYGLG